MQIVQMLQHSLSSCFKNPVGVAERSLEVLVSVSYVSLSEQRYPLSELLYIYTEVIIYYIHYFIFIIYFLLLSALSLLSTLYSILSYLVLRYLTSLVLSFFSF